MNPENNLKQLSQLVYRKDQLARQFNNYVSTCRKNMQKDTRRAGRERDQALQHSRNADQLDTDTQHAVEDLDNQLNDARQWVQRAEARVQDLQNNWPFSLNPFFHINRANQLDGARGEVGRAREQVNRLNEAAARAAAQHADAHAESEAARQRVDALNAELENLGEAARKQEDDIAAERERHAAECQKLDREIREAHSAFIKQAFLLKPAESGLAPCIPWGHLTVLGASCPAQVRLPFAHGLHAAQTRRSVEMVLWMACDILHYSAPGSVQVTLVDTYEMGRRFNALFTDTPLLEGGKIYTDPGESAGVIAAFAQSIADMRRDTLGSRYATWNDYRLAHPEHPLPYRLLIVANAQEMLLEGSAELRRALSAIMREGPQAGILPVFLMAADTADKRRADAVQRLLRDAKAVDIMRTPAYIAKLPATFPNLGISWKAGYPDGARRNLRNALQAVAGHETAPDHGISRLLAEACTAASSEDGVSVPVGWDAATNAPAMFMLDDAHPHAFIGGQTGMGKSNFMHVLLHAWMKRYGADELQIYILDFKEGVEMHEYARHGLPHVQLVARKCDMDFATSMLEHLQGVNEERAELFRAAGVTCIEQYRRQTGRTLPRIVLLVDECQNLFNQDSMGASETISRMATQLVRTGRSQGIHLVLSCQSLSGMTWNSPQLWSNIRVRVALKCMERESRSILSENNRAAAQITERKQAVLNLNNGEPEDNTVVNVPLADVASEPLQEHLRQLAQPGVHVREYRGAEPLPLPAPAAFAAPGRAGALWLGGTATFREAPVLLPFYDAEERAGLAMLACMGTADAAAALRAAAVRSAAASPAVDEAVILYRRADGCPADLPAKCRAAAVEELTPDAWRDILSPAPEGRAKLVYIQALDRMQGILKFPDRFASAKAREGLGAMLADALENVDETRLAVIADFKRMPDSMLLKDIRAHFGSFLVQGVAEEDARRFLGRVDMKPTGLGTGPDSRCKALLAHLSRELAFRPFMQPAGAAV